MKNTRIIASTLAVGGLLLTSACTGGSSGTATGSGSGTGTASSGPKSAAITVVYSALPAGLDPDSTSTTDSSIQQVVTTSYMGTLFSYNGVKSSGNTPPKLAPDLASGMTLSADKKTVTVTLRNTKSSFGNPLTAQDVVWTMKRALHAKANGATDLSQINIDTANPATVVDTHTVAFHLLHPTALFENILALPAIGIIDATEAKKHVTAKDPYATDWLLKHSASFGPYQVTSITPNSSVVMTANPGYWKGVPQITKVTFRVVQDPSTQLQTALTGQSDYTISLPATDLKTVKSSPTVTAHELPVPSVVALNFDTKNAAVRDVRVRQAISLAIDRSAIASTVYDGTATPTTGCLPASITKTTTANDVSATPQLAKAKALLAQVPGKHSITLALLAGFGEGATISRLLQSQLGAIGITVNLRSFSTFTTLLPALKSHALGGFVLESAPYVADAGYFFKAFFLSTAPFNVSSFDVPAFDAATNNAMSEPAPARNAQIQAACSIFTKVVPSAQLVEAGNLTVTKKNITNVQAIPDVAPRIYNLHVG